MEVATESNCYVSISIFSDMLLYHLVIQNTLDFDNWWVSESQKGDEAWWISFRFWEVIDFVSINGLLLVFYGTSNFVYYLKQNAVYTYILNIYYFRTNSL